MTEARKQGQKRRQKELQEEMKEKGKDGQQQQKEQQQQGGRSTTGIALTVTHLQGPLLFLLMGLGAGALSFLVEVLHRYCVKSNLG